MCVVNKPSRLTMGASTSGLHPAISRRLAAPDASGKPSIRVNADIDINFSIGRLSLLEHWAGTTVERAECLLAGNRGAQLEIVPGLGGFLQPLDFEEIH